MTTPPTIRTDDWHTAGEPFRIVTAGAPPLPGASVAERRGRLMTDAEADRVRRLLCHEPRGHADMYGCYVTPPDDDGADMGAVFWHTDGYSTACGHGTIALGAWAVDTGRVPAPDDGTAEVVIDVPSGRVRAVVTRHRGATTAVAFVSVPTWVAARQVQLPTSRGILTVDIAWGGALYASLPAASAGLAVVPEHLGDIVALAREIKAALAGTPHAEHPDDPRLSGIYGVIVHDDLGATAEGPHQRNVTVFADGEVDRSPCGSGTAARVALLADAGDLRPDQALTHDSIIGTRFVARIAEVRQADGRTTWVPEVTGLAHRTGIHTFTLDADDDLDTGFVLR